MAVNVPSFLHYTPNDHQREAGSKAHRTWALEKAHTDATEQFFLPPISAALSHLPTFSLSRAILALTHPPQQPRWTHKKALRDTQVHPHELTPFFPLNPLTLLTSSTFCRRSNYSLYEKALSQDESLEPPSLKSAFPGRAALHSSCLAAHPPPSAHFKGFPGFL